MSKRTKKGGNPKTRTRVTPLIHTVTPIGLAFPSTPPADALAIEPKAAPELVDLASIFGDLLTAAMAAHHVNEPTIAESGLVFLRRACWEAAIIAYGRCFNKGQGVVGRTRTTLHPFVDGLSPDLRAVHNQVLALRDKRIGHHVASESGQEIALSLDVGRGSPGVLTLNDVYVSVKSELYDTPLLGQLGALTRELQARVGARIDELRFEIHAKALADPGGLTKALDSGTPWAPTQGKVAAPPGHG